MYKIRLDFNVKQTQDDNLTSGPARNVQLYLLVFRDGVRLSVGASPAACQPRRRTARPRWCNAVRPHAVHQAGPAGSRVLLHVQYGICIVNDEAG